MKRFYVLLYALVSVCAAMACTSLIALGNATDSGRPLLWKHRDTGAADNFLYRVDPPGGIGYVALFNGGDTLAIDDAWMGMNDAGFAIMNTVAYNLPANSPQWTDREGAVMSLALARCRTVDDFAALLDSLPRPMGVLTNFGCIDAEGGAAYFETDDSGYVRFDAADSPSGVLVRTNYAYSGAEGAGRGYVRHKNVEFLLADQISSGSLTPASCIEGVSRSFYCADLGYDALDTGDSRIAAAEYVPRPSSTASIVVEGVAPGQSPCDMMMWAVVGYPPVCPVSAVRLDSIPAEVSPQAPGCHAPAAVEALRIHDRVYQNRSGDRYTIDGDVLREAVEAARARSLEVYSQAYSQP